MTEMTSGTRRATLIKQALGKTMLIVVKAAVPRLVDGSKIFVDSSLIDANASNNSVLDTKSLKDQLHKNYKKLEARLEDNNESTGASRNIEKKNSRYIYQH